MLKHYQILTDTDDRLVVKFNPSAALYAVTTGKGHRIDEPHANLDPQGRPKRGALIWFNTNYFHQGQIIGQSASEGQPNKYLTPERGVRPVLSFSPHVPVWGATDALRVLDPLATIFEAGPRLVENGEVMAARGCQEGRFQRDAVRKADHLAIGTYVVGAPAQHRVIVGWFKNETVGEIAHLMRHYGCADAMKLDGGHSCCLRLRDPESGLAIDRGAVKVPTIGCMFVLKA